MNHATTHQVLQRLLHLHSRSLAMYLHDAAPARYNRDSQTMQALNHLVADQQDMVDRIALWLIDNDVQVDLGEFPMEFTGLNDLSLEYLLPRLIAWQQEDVATISECVEQLQHDPRAQALAQEALGAAKGHLDSLRELTRAPDVAFEPTVTPAIPQA